MNEFEKLPQKILVIVRFFYINIREHYLKTIVVQENSLKGSSEKTQVSYVNGVPVDGISCLIISDAA